MMKLNATLTLFAVLIVLLVVFNLSLWLVPLTSEEDTLFLFPSAHHPVTEINAEAITRVRIEHRGSDSLTLVFSRENAKKDWVMEKPKGYRVEQSLVDLLVRNILNAQRQDTELEEDPERYNLHEPKTVITLSSDDRTFQLKLGEPQQSGQVFALSSEDEDQPVIVRASSVREALYRVGDFRARTLLGTIGDIDYFSIRKPGEEPITLATEGEGKGWSFLEPDYGGADSQGDPTAGGDAPTGVHAILSALSSLRVADESGFHKDGASDAELADFQLRTDKSAPPEARPSLIITVKKSPDADESTTLLIGKKVGEDSHYARVNESRNVVKVPAKPLETLRAFLKDPSKVRDHSLVRIEGEVDAIELKNLGSKKSLYLIKTDEGAKGPHGGARGVWRVYSEKGGEGMMTEPAVVDQLLDRLRAPRVVRSFPEEAELKKKAVEVRLWGDGVPENPKNAASKMPEIKGDPNEVLTFGEEDPDKGVLVRRERGEKSSVVIVPGDLLGLVSKPKMAFLARTIVPYTQEPAKDVTKLIVVEDGKTTEIAKQGTDWIIKAPEHLAGRNADANQVMAILLTMQQLRVVEWASLDADPEALKKFGLAEPKVRVSITLGGAGKPAEFLFGSDVPGEEERVYAKLGKEKRVFQVSSLVTQEIGKPLQDMTIFRFDPSEVERIDIRGWKAIFGAAKQYSIKRTSSGGWTGVTPTDFRPDGNKVDIILQRMSQLKAEQFLVYKTGPKDFHGLAIDKEIRDRAGLELTLTFKDKEREPLIFTLGAVTVSGKLCASTSKFPGDVFTVTKEVFEEYLDKPGSLVR